VPGGEGRGGGLRSILGVGCWLLVGFVSVKGKGALDIRSESGSGVKQEGECP
jgi:hypothetical protein